MFYQPNMPKLEDYYEPFEFDYSNLYNAPEGDDQPVADAISMITGKKMDTISGGPNWDDDLSGSPLYAAEDLNLEDRKIIEEYGKIFMLYLRGYAITASTQPVWRHAHPRQSTSAARTGLS